MNELEVALCTTQKMIGWEANFNWLWQFKLHYDEYSGDEYGDYDDESGDGGNVVVDDAGDDHDDDDDDDDDDDCDDGDDCDDIYIMMQCLFVTKNEHFLLGVSCNHLNHP